MEWARKCISDGANVNYQDKVGYDVYHIEGSVVNEVFFTCTKHLHHNTSHSNIGSGTDCFNNLVCGHF